MNDANHLITIGISSFGDLEFWDPGTVTADFLSFHIYGDSHPDNKTDKQVIRYFENEMYWINGNIHLKKPWIIGETGYASTNDSVLPCDTNAVIKCPSFLDTVPNPTCETRQRQYCITTQTSVKACGGSGYSWWDYQDTREGNSTCNPGAHYGIFDNCHNPKILIANENVFNLDPNVLCGSFNPPDSMDVFYYRHFPGFDYIITGYIIDYTTDEPIRDALITGFLIREKEDTLRYRNHTFSDSRGHFKLIYNLHNDSLNYLSIAAMGKDRIIKDLRIIGAFVDNNGSCDIGVVKVKNLECTSQGQLNLNLIDDTSLNSKKIKSDLDVKSIKNQIKLHPNPSNGLVYLSIILHSATSVQVEILSLLQNTLRKMDFGFLEEGDYSKQLHLDFLPNGIYLLKVTTNQGSEVFKIIVNK